VSWKIGVALAASKYIIPMPSKTTHANTLRIADLVNVASVPHALHKL
jgi:hypothetical protein